MRRVVYLPETSGLARRVQVGYLRQLIGMLTDVSTDRTEDHRLVCAFGIRDT